MLNIHHMGPTGAKCEDAHQMVKLCAIYALKALKERKRETENSTRRSKKAA